MRRAARCILHPGYNVSVATKVRDAPGPSPPDLPPLPRWVTPLLTLSAAGLVPWTLWLTFSLPARHVSSHYDVAWVGFDVGLFAVFATTAWSAFRRSEWLVPLAAVLGTMLVCDAWFDIVTSTGQSEQLEAILEAVFAELPLATICAFIVYDAEKFLQATVHAYRARVRRRRAR
jgi:hypothetical protein